MKILRYTYMIALAAVTAVMAACSSDSETPDQPNPNEKDGLTLRIATEMPTRARTTEWVDANAQDEEMMNLWVVVVTNTSDGEVQHCFACRPAAGGEREIDDLPRITKGAYTIYSFANISVSDVCSLLGLTEPNVVKDIDSTPIELEEIRGTVRHSAVAAKVTTVNGNGFDPTAADNGFGEQGIPMSNKQTTTANDSYKDLIVVRMLAKFEVQVTNERTTPVTIKSISLTDVTANTTNNLKLLPNYGTAPNYPDDMEAHHKDIQPNLGSGATRGNLTIIPAGNAEQRTVAAGGTKTFTFYVNESVAPDNGSGLFYLSLGFDGEAEYHHALINQKGSTTDDDDAWHYIARNDYRIIPIHLTDWLFRIEPIAFVPIAGYPAVLLSSNALTATYNTGGMIALQPFVKKYNDTSWRDFDDLEVTYGEVVKDATDPNKDDVEKSWNKSITWTNIDGTKVSGPNYIITSPFTYDDTHNCIIGELNNNLPNTYTASSYKTAITFKLKLGPQGEQYTYTFTCDVVLQK